MTDTDFENISRSHLEKMEANQQPKQLADFETAKAHVIDYFTKQYGSVEFISLIDVNNNHLLSFGDDFTQYFLDKYEPNLGLFSCTSIDFNKDKVFRFYVPESYQDFETLMKILDK